MLASGQATCMRRHSKATLIAATAALEITSSIAAGVEDSVAVFQRCHGSVQIERGETRISATAGDELYRGDRIITDADAYAEIRVRGAAPLLIGPSANVAVERFAADERPTLARSMSSLATWTCLPLERF